MKKFFYLLAVLFTATVFTSCSDDENGGGSDTPTEAEYTICMYATGGDNLDFQIISELLQNAEGVASTNGKVRFVGIYKPSPKHQAILGESGGTRYFELASNSKRSQEDIASDVKTLISVAESNLGQDSIPGLMADQILAADLIGEKYADADFKMYEPDNIAAALKFLTEKAPAKQYILLADDHGTGWNFSVDKALTTRGMLGDNDRSISLDEFNAGVSKSGIKFSALFCDLCLMAHLENLYGYSENFPICIASAETTTGSNVGTLAQRLAALGGSATHDQLFSECSDWVTTTNENSGYRTWETYAGLKEIDGHDFQDMGCYDLTKIDNLTSPLTAIAKWYINAMSDSELKYIAEKSVLTTLYTTTPSDDINLSLYSQQVLGVVANYLGNPNMKIDEIADEILKGKGADLYNLLRNNSDKQVVNYFSMQCRMGFGFPLAYFVWNTERIAKDYKMTKVAEELDQLLSNYLEALKGMCKIKCSYDDFPGCTFAGVDYPEMDAYLWTSPTIVISSLESNSYQNLTRIDFSPWAHARLSLSDNLAAYNNTKFDQLTNWSSFLQELEVNPNVVTNFFRQTPVYYAKFGSVK